MSDTTVAEPATLPASGAPGEEVKAGLREFEEVRRRARELLASLTSEQWAWKPARDRWSAGEAIAHINHYGSAHSDAIVTTNSERAKQFLQEVDSATVYWNASTRFTDGGEFGMGAEIGISTDKIGARGPMGLEELTSYKWIGYGQGQVRT